MSDDRIIRASEIGQYDFCAKAWWLGSIEGVEPANVRELQGGAAAHEWHGRQITRAGRLQTIAVALLLLGVVLLAVAAVRGG